MGLQTAPKQLLDLPWHDVIFPLVLPHLSWHDLFHLRAVSIAAKHLVTEYFKVQSALDISSISRTITLPAFIIITKDAQMLKILNVADCKWLDSNHLCAVLSRNPGLVSVELSGCSGLSNIVVETLAKSCGPSLRKAIFRDCHWLDPKTLQDLVETSSGLEYLDVTSCWLVNNDAVTSLAKNCNRLRFLSLSKIYRITNYSLYVIALYCHALEELVLEGCWRVSDEGVRFVSEYCRRLKKLNVKECRDISEEYLASLEGKYILERSKRDYHQNLAFIRMLRLNSS